MSVDSGRDAVAVLGLESEKVRRRLFRVLILLAVVVFVVTFALSWDALMQLAQASYIDPHLAMAFPLTVDALAVTSFIAGILLSRHRWHVRFVPAGVTLFFAALSITGNGLHAYSRGGHLHIQQWQAVAVSAVPPVSGMVMIHLFTLLLRHLVSTPATVYDVADEVIDEGYPDRQMAVAGTGDDVRSIDSSPAAMCRWIRAQWETGRELSEPGFTAEIANRFQVSPKTAENRKREVRDGKDLRRLTG